jgi:uncharacterized glyoxalase superfamily protein PhnB
MQDHGAALQATAFSVSFTVNDLQRSIQYYTDAFGFEIKDRYESDGQLRYVEMRAGSCSLGLGQDDFAKGRNRVKGVGLRFFINTAQDLHALAARARAAGAILDADPAPLPWGPLAFSFTDPDGFNFTIANE